MYRSIKSSKIFFIAIVLISFISTLNAEVFRVGYFDIPPHTYLTKKSQKPKGKAIEFFEKIKDRMGIKKVSYVVHPLPRLLKMLEFEKLDMILLLGKNSNREAKFSYPKLQFYNLQPSMVLLNDNPIDQITNVEQMLSLRIGGYQKGYYSPMLRDNRLKLKPLSGNNIETRNLELMIRGRLDVVYCPDYYIVEDAISKSKYFEDVKIIKLGEEDIGAYSVFSKKSAIKYLKSYEKALEVESKIQTYEEFLNIK